MYGAVVQLASSGHVLGYVMLALQFILPAPMSWYPRSNTGSIVQSGTHVSLGVRYALENQWVCCFVVQMA